MLGRLTFVEAALDLTGATNGRAVDHGRRDGEYVLTVVAAEPLDLDLVVLAFGERDREQRVGRVPAVIVEPELRPADLHNPDRRVEVADALDRDDRGTRFGRPQRMDRGVVGADLE